MTEYLEPSDVEALLEEEGFHYKDGTRGRNLLLSSLAAPMPVFGQDVHPSVAAGDVELDALAGWIGGHLRPLA